MPENKISREGTMFEAALKLQTPIKTILKSHFSDDEERSVSYKDRHGIPHYITPRSSDHMHLQYETSIDDRRVKVSLQAQARRNLYTAPDGKTYEGVGIAAEQISNEGFTPTQGYLVFITEDYQIFSERGTLVKSQRELTKYTKLVSHLATHFDCLLAEEALVSHPEETRNMAD